MKKNTYYIHPHYPKLQKEVKSVAQNFEHIGSTLRNKRNHLKVDKWHGIEVCIKSFKKPTLFNQLVYGLIRKTKAQRSFQYALQLDQLQVHSPAPIAYSECRNSWGGLTKAYYICQYEKYDFLFSDIPNSNLNYKEKSQVIHTLVKLTCSKFYDNMLFNRDFNGSNVLVSQQSDGQYSFSFVDINRIHYAKKTNQSRELRNLSMLSDNPQILCLIAEAYATIRQKDIKETTFALFSSKYLFRRKRQAKKNILYHLKEASSKPHLKINRYIEAHVGNDKLHEGIQNG